MAIHQRWPPFQLHKKCIEIYLHYLSVDMLERQLVDGLDLKNGFSLWKHERSNIALSFCIITYFIEVYNNTMSRFLVAAGVCISLMGLSEGSDAPFLHSYKSFRAKSSPKFRLRSRSPFVSTHKHTVSPPSANLFSVLEHRFLHPFHQNK